MATFPYNSGQTAIVKTFEQFRKSFPPSVDAGLLKRFGIAPGNESYIINILRFLGFIDDDGKKVESKADIFFHGTEQFQTGLKETLADAYAELFAERGEGAWTEPRDTLATWFRVKDKTSELIGARQASTFLTLASISGVGEPIKPVVAATPRAPRKSDGAKPPKEDKKKQAGAKATELPSHQTVDIGNGGGARGGKTGGDLGLTVRIEVNLPPGESAETYDAIFASIRKNLIDRG